MKHFKSINFLFFGIFFFLILGANTTVVYSDQIDYSVNALLPENQSDKKATYFDLNMSPGQKQTLSIEVTNNSNKEISLIAEVNNAITNQNGIIDYSKHDFQKDSSLKVSLEDIVKNNYQEILLKPKESKKLSIDLEMPSNHFDGIILGGIRFSEKIEKDELDKKSNVQIKNRYAYTIGILLKENEKVLDPDLHLLSAQAELMNYRQVITGTIQNDKPVILRDLEINATVTKKNEKEVYAQANQNNMKMAPNSQFDFPIQLNGRDFKPGKYTLNVNATADNKNYKWSFSKDFTIKNKEAKELNDEAVPNKKDKEIPLWVYAISVVAALIVIIWLLKFFRGIYHHKSSKNKK